MFITTCFDIFPKARKTLKKIPADTEVIVSKIVILAPPSKGGIQDTIFCRVSICLIANGLWPYGAYHVNVQVLH